MTVTSPVRSRPAIALLAAVAAIGLSACGGTDTPSSSEAATNVVASFTEVGVSVTDKDRACVVDKVKGKISDTELTAAKMTDLSQPSRVLVATAMDECWSDATIASAMGKTIAAESGLSAKASTCLTDAVAGKVAYPDLVKQTRAAVDHVAKAARKCAQAA